MNKIIVVGNLAADPKLRATASGISVCSFTLAVNRPKNANGESIADFIPVVVWREPGEACGKYLKKGSKAAVCGALQMRTYADKEGIKRTIAEIYAERVEFLSPRTEAPAEESGSPEGFEEIEDGDLPF